MFSSLLAISSSSSEVFSEYHDHVDCGFHSSDPSVAASGRLVYQPFPETEGAAFLQNRDLSSEPDHGLCFFHAVFYPVREHGAGQFYFSEYGHLQRAIPVHVPRGLRKSAGGDDELPDVVR